MGVETLVDCGSNGLELEVRKVSDAQFSCI